MSEAPACASLQRVHHLLDPRLLCLRALSLADSSNPFLLVCVGQRLPGRLCGFVGSDHLLDLGGNFDYTSVTVALEDNLNDIAGLAFSTCTHFLVNCHHVAVAHVAQRAAK